MAAILAHSMTLTRAHRVSFAEIPQPRSPGAQPSRVVPLVVVEEIAKILDAKDRRRSLANLLQCSKRYYDLLEPHLYRKIQLHTGPRQSLLADNDACREFRYDKTNGAQKGHYFRLYAGKLSRGDQPGHFSQEDQISYTHRVARLRHLETISIASIPDRKDMINFLSLTSWPRWWAGHPYGDLTDAEKEKIVPEGKVKLCPKLNRIVLESTLFWQLRWFASVDGLYKVFNDMASACIHATNRTFDLELVLPQHPSACSERMVYGVLDNFFAGAPFDGRVSSIRYSNVTIQTIPLYFSETACCPYIVSFAPLQGNTKVSEYNRLDQMTAFITGILAFFPGWGEDEKVMKNVTITFENPYGWDSEGRYYGAGFLKERDLAWMLEGIANGHGKNAMNTLDEIVKFVFT